MRHITIYECYDKLKITKEGSNTSISVKEADELNRYIESQKLDSRNIIWIYKTIYGSDRDIT